ELGTHERARRFSGSDFNTCDALAEAKESPQQRRATQVKCRISAVVCAAYELATLLVGTAQCSQQRFTRASSARPMLRSSTCSASDMSQRIQPAEFICRCC